MHSQREKRYPEQDKQEPLCLRKMHQGHLDTPKKSEITDENRAKYIAELFEECRNRRYSKSNKTEVLLSIFLFHFQLKQFRKQKQVKIITRKQ